ncbi:Inositol-pentakisphosphate 2-kinase [Tulasnella sp. JGI-2019a]|nr:Inositol-pentakisphosphate 2-kinase [Tulasnella sp. JGI-2019a]
MTALSITTTSPTDWTYVSEGGANIVLAYKGASDDNFSGSVLRLRAMHIDADSSTKSNEPEQQADDPSIAFQKHIISKLISPAFLPRLEAVDLDEPWLRELAIKTEPSRPLSRRTVQIIDAKQARGVLASDLIGSTGWAVEIKVSDKLGRTTWRLMMTL